jgi:hypothetical protein
MNETGGRVNAMAADPLRYDRMVEQALRGVVKQSLEIVARSGFPGDHHFYLTFRTDHPGIGLPAALKSQYPDEMTIVLQYQFWGLEVDEEAFEVTLSFNKMQERLHVPFAALTGFVDPSVQFGLQFKGEVRPGELVEPAAELRVSGETPQRGGALPGAGGEVVALDAFRRK